MFNSSEYAFGIVHLFVYLHFRCTGECILYSNDKSPSNRISFENQPWTEVCGCRFSFFDMETNLCEGQCSQYRIGWKDEDFPIVIVGPIARWGRCRWKLSELGWEEAIAV